MTRLLILALGWWLLWASPAAALPVAVVSVLTAGFTASVASVVTSFLVRTAIMTGISFVAGKIFGPKIPKGGGASAQERQAGVLALSVGEGPREAIFGEAATGGSLAGAFNYGGTNGTDWVVRVIIIADHPCESLQGFYVNDILAPYTADGVHGGFGHQLEIHWRNGAADQAFPAALMAAWRSSPMHAAQAPVSDTPFQGMTYVVVAYKADAPDAQDPVWSGGHPQFLFIVRGKRCYDPRLDTTVGGSGPQRWNAPATWTWTRNAAVCRYNWVRGIYAQDQVDDPGQLLVGRGLSTLEAPPQRVFAYANLCDEVVEDHLGGVEFRYSVDGVIRSTDDYLSVENMFEAAMAGRLIQPDGGVEVEPGQAKTPVYAFTDADLVAGRPVSFNAFGSDAQRVNTVIPRYIEPTQKYQDHAGPVRRDLADLALDGGPREETLSLVLVTKPAQAQRVAEIRRRAARLERTATVPMPPRFSEAEAGDWVQWTSARHTGGEPVVFRIVSQGTDQGWGNEWALEETGFDVYGFGGSPLPPGPGQEPITPPDALVLTGVTVEAIQIEGDTGSIVPAIRFGWDTPVDPAVTRIRAEVRAVGATLATPTTTDLTSSGELLVTNGVTPNLQLQGRLVPLGAPGRPIVPSAWVTVSTGNLVADTALGFEGVSFEAIAESIADGEALADAFAIYALKQSSIVEAFRRAGFTPDGLPLGPFAADLKVRTDNTVQDLYLIGVRSEDGLAFELSQTTLKVGGEILAEQLDVLFAASAEAFGQIINEASIRASAIAAQASQISALSSTVGGFSATLVSHSSTLATLDGRTQASWEIIAAAGSDPAYAKLVATNTGSGIAFAAQEIALFNFVGGVLHRVMRLVSGMVFFSGPVFIDLGSARLGLGPGFGASNDLLFWFGAQISPSSMTKTNGKWSFASDLKAYYSGSELTTGGGFRLQASPAAISAGRSGAGTVTTATVTLTPIGNSGSVTYSWRPGVDVATGITVIAPSNNATTFSGHVNLGQEKEAVFFCIAVDAAGNQAQIGVPVLLSEFS